MICGSPEFRACFSSLFPPDLEGQQETWFSSHSGTLLSDSATLLYGAEQGGREMMEREKERERERDELFANTEPEQLQWEG